MQSTQNLTKKRKQVEKRHHYEDAAQVVITSFKSPSQLLDFVTDVSDWTHKFSKDQESNCHFLSILLMDSILKKWITSNGDIQCAKNIAIGITEIEDALGYTDLHEYIGYLLQAWGKSFKDGYHNSEYLRKLMLGISAIMEIYCHIHDKHLLDEHSVSN